MFVYFIQEGSDGPIKIGFSKNPAARVNELQVGNSKELKLIGYFEPETDEQSEEALHALFEKHKVRGEWFTCTNELRALIGRLVSKSESPDIIKQAVTLLAFKIDDETLAMLDLLVEDYAAMGQPATRAHAIRQAIRFVHKTRPWGKG